MKKNIAIIGFGVMGKRFFNHLKTNNKVNILKIIVKTKRRIIYKNKNICGTYSDIKDLNNLHGVVIATAFKASFKYAHFFLTKKIPILIEKPFCETILQSIKLFSLYKKKKSIFLINYSDLFDPKFIQLIKKGTKQIKNIKIIESNYGNNKILYPVRKKFYPIQNWISHPISMFLSICGDIKKFKITNYKILYKKGFIFEKVQIKLIKKNLDLTFNFSNLPGVNCRNIKIIGQKGFLKFNSYISKDNYISFKKKKHISSKIKSVENILNIFLNDIIKKNKNSNIKLGVKEHLLSTSILKKISFLRKKKQKLVHI